jgi:deoxyadenosine/deoxycytidine kinase
MNRVKYIAIEGVIGVGKTTLARLLAKELHGKALLEEVSANPFLPKFYQHGQTYAFQTQIFFLLSRFKQQQQIIQEDILEGVVVTDYLFEKDKIFAYHTLSEDELKIYETLFSLIEKHVPTPDLVIYLQASLETLMARIAQRNIPYERNITQEYILELIKAFNHFFFHYQKAPVMVVDTTTIDFVTSEADRRELFEEIKKPHTGIEYYTLRRERKEG